SRLRQRPMHRPSTRSAPSTIAAPGSRPCGSAPAIVAARPRSTLRHISLPQSLSQPSSPPPQGCDVNESLVPFKIIDARHYHIAIEMSWKEFALAFVRLELGINVVFALLYLAMPGCVVARPSSNYSPYLWA